MELKWLAVSLVFLAGCSTSATITRRSASPIDAEIVGGDSENVYIKYAGVFRDTIPRREITDIDHPGNVAATIGGVVTAYGIANIAVGAPDCDKRGPAYCMGVFLPGAIGLPIMAWGLGTYIRSVTALDKASASRQTGRFFVVPTDQLAGQPKTPGVTVGGTF